MKDNLIVLSGGADSQTLEQAEDELRVRARSLGSQIDKTYWELGRALYEIYDGLPGGWAAVRGNELTQEARRGLYSKWGYTSFEEYCEKEIGLQRRTASSLRYAYWWFEHQMSLPTEIKERLLKLGRSKLYKLAGFVDNDNIITWLEKSAELTVEELGKEIKKAKAVRMPGHDANFSEGDDLFDGKAPSEFSNGHRAAPAPETAHTLTTSLYEGQWNTWQQAFDRAKGLTGSDKISHNLEMICLDYLSTNDFMSPEDDIKAYLSKLENMLGLKIIAVDPQSGKPKYGTDLLWMLVKARTDLEAVAEKVPSSTIKSADQPPVAIVEAEDDSDPPPAF